MLILASQSPRRREILTNAGIPFLVRAASVPEAQNAGETPHEYVSRLSRSKAEAVEMFSGEVILGADTVVLLDGKVLEKPANDRQAREMLHALSGREHSVLTGICLRHAAGLVSNVEETRVQFCSLTADEIDQYAGSGEPMDKAGAYGIQGLASKFIERINGCYFNVVGLPIALVYRELKRVSGQMSSPG